MASPPTPASHATSAALMRQATMAAVVCALLLIAVKTYAYTHTGSVALLSSLADSALAVR